LLVATRPIVNVTNEGSNPADNNTAVAFYDYRNILILSITRGAARVRISLNGSQSTRHTLKSPKIV